MGCDVAGTRGPVCGFACVHCVQFAIESLAFAGSALLLCGVFCISILHEHATQALARIGAGGGRGGVASPSGRGKQQGMSHHHNFLWHCRRLGLLQSFILIAYGVDIHGIALCTARVRRGTFGVLTRDACGVVWAQADWGCIRRCCIRV